MELVKSPTTRIVSPYKRRPIQTEIHKNLKRFSVLNIHRRFGKTVLAINELIKQVLTCKHPKPRGAYIAPFRSQAKSIAWQYLKDYTECIPNMKYNESELRADFPNGARITLFGSDNPNAIRGLYLDYAVLDETAQINPILWSSVIRPLLTDRKGGALFIGTPLGMANMFYRLYEQAADDDTWFRQTYKASETAVIDDEELAAAQREMSPEEYEQEFECSWSAAIKGAFYAKQMAQAENDQRITTVPYDRSYPVITSCDLGVRDSFVVWYWQIVGSQHRAIRCEAFTGMLLADVIKQMFSHGYQFSQHIAPFDINVRELGAGSRIKTAQRLGIKYTVAPSPHEVSRASGINQVRNMLERTVFDRNNCKDGIEALKNYRSEYNEQRQVLSTNPLHDWSSDYCDSLRYYAVTKKKNTTLEEFTLDYSRQDQGVY